MIVIFSVFREYVKSKEKSNGKPMADFKENRAKDNRNSIEIDDSFEIDDILEINMEIEE